MGDSQKQRQTRLRTRYGPWAIVTGASSGIGRAIAIQLAAAQLNLILVARSHEKLAQLAADLMLQHQVEIQVIATDLAEMAGLARVIAETDDRDVGLLVAAAGFGTSGRFLDSALGDELVMLNLNCRALLVLTQTFGARFAARGRGGIILLSSIVGFQGMPNAAHYAATKAYVQVLAEALHVEFAPLGVDLLAAAPGPTESGFAARAGMRMGQALNPADVAQATLLALGRTTTTLPGLLSKILVYSLMLLPRMARVRIMGQVMGNMTRHRYAES